MTMKVRYMKYMQNRNLFPRQIITPPLPPISTPSLELSNQILLIYLRACSSLTLYIHFHPLKSVYRGRVLGQCSGLILFLAKSRKHGLLYGSPCLQYNQLVSPVLALDIRRFLNIFFEGLSQPPRLYKIKKISCFYFSLSLSIFTSK